MHAVSPFFAKISPGVPRLVALSNVTGYRIFCCV